MHLRLLLVFSVYFIFYPLCSEAQFNIYVPDSTGGVTNPFIDSDAFLKDAAEAHNLRKKHLLSEEKFIEFAKDRNTIILDARSLNRFQQLHITGARSLPFTEFTEATLKELIPSKDTRILIYCNNNIENNTPATTMAFATKAAPASLNLSTFSSLFSYGYKNVYELAPLIDIKNTNLKFEGDLLPAQIDAAIPDTVPDRFEINRLKILKAYQTCMKHAMDKSKNGNNLNWIAAQRECMKDSPRSVRING